MTRRAIILMILITGEDRSENIITTSTDGRVAQWMIRKGFESIGKKTYFEAKITHFNNFKSSLKCLLQGKHFDILSFKMILF